MKYITGKTTLVLEDVPKHREELLKRIMDDVKKTKTAFEPVGKVVISGLESPILVRQVNEQQVELYLRYALSLETKY